MIAKLHYPPLSAKPDKSSHSDLHGFIDRRNVADRALNSDILRLLHETAHPQHKHQRYDQNDVDIDQFQ